MVRIKKGLALLLALCMVLTCLPGLAPAAEAAVVGSAHNFTEDGLDSDFFTISGNLSTSKGSVSYAGMTLTQCLKMETATTISFTADQSGTLLLVFGGSSDPSGKAVKLDGTSYQVGTDGTLLLSISAGSHTVTKGAAIFLYYMEFALEANVYYGNIHDFTADGLESDFCTFTGELVSVESNYYTNATLDSNLNRAFQLDASSLIALTVPSPGYLRLYCPEEDEGKTVRIDDVEYTMGQDIQISGGTHHITAEDTVNLLYIYAYSGVVGHRLWMIDTITAATCTVDGEILFVCEMGQQISETIPATGHSYVNGSCTLCGEADPDAALPEVVGPESYAYEHAFTADGVESDVFTIAGETHEVDSNYYLSVNLGDKLHTALKLDSSASIAFSLPKDGTLTMYCVESDAGKRISIDAAEYTLSDDGVLGASLAAGDHIITGIDAVNVLLISVYSTNSAMGGNYIWRGTWITEPTCQTKGVMSFDNGTGMPAQTVTYYYGNHKYEDYICTVCGAIDNYAPAFAHHQNFTADGLTGDFYSFTGTLHSAESNYYTETSLDSNLNVALKLNASASIAFTNDGPGYLTLFCGEADAGKRFSVDGTEYTVGEDGCVSVFVTVGEHTVTGVDTLDVFYMLDVQGIVGWMFYTGTVTKEPTCTADGELTLKCSSGMPVDPLTIPATGHSYSGGYCTVCGAADPNYTAPTPLFDLAGANMKLGSDLTMYFYVNASDLSGTDYSMQLVKVSADGTSTVKTVAFADWEPYGSMYRVSLDGIAAKEMTDRIYVTVYGSNGAVSNIWGDSVRDYAVRMLDKNSNAKTSTLMADMLNYGAAAQRNFGYNTSDLANSTMTATHQSYASNNFSMGSFSNEAVSGTGYIGSSLSLNTNICLTVYFNGSIVNESMKARVSYTDHYGVAQSYEVSGSDFVTSGTYKGVEVGVLAAADAESLVTVEIYDGSTVVASASDSVESYAVRKYASNELFVELMKFASSAYNYFHS